MYPKITSIIKLLLVAVALAHLCRPRTRPTQPNSTIASRERQKRPFQAFGFRGTFHHFSLGRYSPVGWILSRSWKPPNHGKSTSNL